jgi:hypothetical protein
MAGSMADAIHLEQTRYFIGENPIDISITRSSRVSDGAGGWKFDSPATLDPITVRKVGINAQSAAVKRTNENGSMVLPTGLLICMPDADIERFDRFSIGEVEYSVIHISTLPPWRKSVEVYEYGQQ